MGTCRSARLSVNVNSREHLSARVVCRYPDTQGPGKPGAIGDTAKATGNSGPTAQGKPQPKPYSALPATGHPDYPASRASAQTATRRSLPGHRAQTD
jgi:hypothetical protein